MKLEQKEVTSNSSSKVSTEYISTLGIVVQHILNKKQSKELLERKTASKVLYAPVISLGYKKRESLNRFKRERNLQYMIQLNHILQGFKTGNNESDFFYFNVTKETMSFFPQIGYMLHCCNPEFGNKAIDLLPINQLLYLVNSNYYEKIKEYMPCYRRKDLTSEILVQVGYYLQRNHIKTFDENAANEIINSLRLPIPKKLRAEIIKEYTAAKEKNPITGEYEYKIVRNDMTANEMEEAFAKQYDITFDSTKIEDFQEILNAIKEGGQFSQIPEELFNIKNWDLNSLQRIVIEITGKSKNKLKDIYGNYTDYGMISALLYEILRITSEREKNKVDKKELFVAVKNTPILPPDVKKDITTEIFPDYVEREERLLKNPEMETIKQFIKRKIYVEN